MQDNKFVKFLESHELFEIGHAVLITMPDGTRFINTTWTIADTTEFCQAHDASFESFAELSN